jgi:hypothetical protein
LKNWNRIGKFKAIIIGILALPNLLAPIKFESQEFFSMILLPFMFPIVAIPLISKFNERILGQKITKPVWNDNPLTLRRSLVSLHFGGFFFLGVGFSILIGNGVRYQTLSFLGLNCISFGLGILIGIQLAVKWARTR